MLLRYRLKFLLRNFKIYREFINLFSKNDWYCILLDADQQWPVQKAQFYWITENEFFEKFNYNLFENIKHKNLFPEITSNFIYDFEPKNFLTTECFCKCGQRLNASNSFLYEYYNEENSQYIFKYECTFCNKISFFNPDIIPGLLPCNEKGDVFGILPFKTKEDKLIEKMENSGELLTKC